MEKLYFTYLLLEKEKFWKLLSSLKRKKTNHYSMFLKHRASPGVVMVLKINGNIF